MIELIVRAAERLNARAIFLCICTLAVAHNTRVRTRLRNAEFKIQDSKFKISLCFHLIYVLGPVLGRRTRWRGAARLKVAGATACVDFREIANFEF